MAKQQRPTRTENRRSAVGRGHRAKCECETSESLWRGAGCGTRGAGAGRGATCARRARGRRARGASGRPWRAGSRRAPCTRWPRRWAAAGCGGARRARAPPPPCLTPSGATRLGGPPAIRTYSTYKICYGSHSIIYRVLERYHFNFVHNCW